MEYHVPVLLNEAIEGLKIDPEGIYVDATFGGGGHSREIIKRIKGGKLFAFDQDKEAAKNKLNSDGFIFINQNFRYLKNFLQLHNSIPVNGILADFGVSSHQFDISSRGFSIRSDAPLDMRMNTEAEKNATDILNNYTENELVYLFRNYGELKNARRIANTLFQEKKKRMITTTEQLKSTIKHLAIKGKENKFFAQVFQALRIEVNDELNAIRDFLEHSAKVLKKEGRLVIISYHSLEDRLAKNYIKKGMFEGEPEKDLYGNIQKPFKALNNKPIQPKEEEIKLNNRARSAKLRIAEKL